LAKCLEIEYTLAREVTRGPDFSEGVRAMLVDKDRSPVWPASARLRREA
jgi:enoyl-CoA hydratase